jgi:hypothetical protein
MTASETRAGASPAMIITRRPARSMPLEFDKDEAVAGEQQRSDLCAVQLLRSRSCRNESRRRISFLGAPRIASELLQLREQGTSPSFDRMSRLVQYRVSAREAGTSLTSR